jgi:hypothetical protein
VATELGEWRERPGLQQIAVELPDGELLFNRLDAGSCLEPHRHPHEQFGTAVVGDFELLVGAISLRVDRRAGYRLLPGVRHGARTAAVAPALSIDVKRLVSTSLCRPGPAVVRCRPEAHDATLTYRLPWGTCVVAAVERAVPRVRLDRAAFAFIAEYEPHSLSLTRMRELAGESRPATPAGRHGVLIALTSWA